MRTLEKLKLNFFRSLDIIERGRHAILVKNLPNLRILTLIGFAHEGHGVKPRFNFLNFRNLEKLHLESLSTRYKELDFTNIVSLPPTLKKCIIKGYRITFCEVVDEFVKKQHFPDGIVELVLTGLYHPFLLNRLPRSLLSAKIGIGRAGLDPEKSILNENSMKLPFHLSALPQTLTDLFISSPNDSGATFNIIPDAAFPAGLKTLCAPIFQIWKLNPKFRSCIPNMEILPYFVETENSLAPKRMTNDWHTQRKHLDSIKTLYISDSLTREQWANFPKNLTHLELRAHLKFKAPESFRLPDTITQLACYAPIPSDWLAKMPPKIEKLKIVVSPQSRHRNEGLLTNLPSTLTELTIDCLDLPKGVDLKEISHLQKLKKFSLGFVTEDQIQDYELLKPLPTTLKSLHISAETRGEPLNQHWMVGIEKLVSLHSLSFAVDVFVPFEDDDEWFDLSPLDYLPKNLKVLKMRLGSNLGPNFTNGFWLFRDLPRKLEALMVQMVEPYKDVINHNPTMTLHDADFRQLPKSLEKLIFVGLQAHHMITPRVYKTIPTTIWNLRFQYLPEVDRERRYEMYKQANRYFNENTCWDGWEGMW